MVQKSTKTKSTGNKRSLKVEDLPKAEQKLDREEMKKVKGGDLYMHNPSGGRPKPQG